MPLLHYSWDNLMRSDVESTQPLVRIQWFLVFLIVQPECRGDSTLIFHSLTELIQWWFISHLPMPGTGAGREIQQTSALPSGSI